MTSHTLRKITPEMYADLIRVNLRRYRVRLDVVAPITQARRRRRPDEIRKIKIRTRLWDVPMGFGEEPFAA